MDRQQQNIAVYNRHVAAYVSKFMTLDLYADSFDALLNVLPADATVLDLGCGPGNVAKYLLAAQPHLQITGIDLAPEMIKVARQQNPTACFHVMDLVETDSLQQTFDAVIAAFCLPYIARNIVDDLFKSFRRLTRKSGLLYLSCMEGPAEKSGFEKTSFTGEDEVYINYYNRHEIERQLGLQQFTVLESFAKDYPEADGSTTTDLIYIAKKL